MTALRYGCRGTRATFRNKGVCERLLLVKTGRRPSVLRGGIKFRFDYRAQVATSETLPPRKGSLMETRRRSCTKMLGKCGGEADIRDQREISGNRLSPIVSRRPATKC